MPPDVEASPPGEAALEDVPAPAAPVEAPWPDLPAPPAPEADFLVPPTLAQATAPRENFSRGLLIAAAFHAVLLVIFLGVIKFRPAPPPPDSTAIMLMVQAGATGGPMPGTTEPRGAPAAQAAKAPANTPAIPPPPPPLPISRTAALAAKPAPPQAKPAPPAHQAVLGANAAPPPGAKPRLSAIGITRPARADSGSTVLYSLYSREAGQQGMVGLQVTVLASGMAGGVVVTKSSGYAALDTVARDAVMTWHFQPALKNGVPVASTLAYVFRFELQ